jgi:hypothetical protein
MGRFDLGGNQGGRRRELAGKIEKGKCQSTGQWLEKEDQGLDASSLRTRNSV